MSGLSPCDDLPFLNWFCACAVFRSAPDTWAIEQVFPILPIHRLDEEPTVAATLADLTCGKSPCASYLHPGSKTANNSHVSRPLSGQYSLHQCHLEDGHGAGRICFILQCTNVNKWHDTCCGGCAADSDGKIDRFISPVGNEAAPVLPLHELRSGHPYLLAMFLTGVYQEVSSSLTGLLFAFLSGLRLLVLGLAASTWMALLLFQS